MDTTYIPMAKGFACLNAVVDWACSKVLAAKVAITFEACHAVAVDVRQEAFNRHGKSETVNIDQGSQFTAQVVREQGSNQAWTGAGLGRIMAYRASVEVGEIRTGLFVPI